MQGAGHKRGGRSTIRPQCAIGTDRMRRLRSRNEDCAPGRSHRVTKTFKHGTLAVGTLKAEVIAGGGRAWCAAGASAGSGLALEGPALLGALPAPLAARLPLDSLGTLEQAVVGVHSAALGADGRKIGPAPAVLARGGSHRAVPCRAGSGRAGASTLGAAALAGGGRAGAPAKGTGPCCA